MKKLGFGMMRLPNREGAIDVELLKKMVDEYLSRGFTYFDTAWMYHNGKSEEMVKECLVDRYERDKFTITTKLPAYMINSFEDRDKVFETQKKRTGCDYFDYYWLHDVNSHSISTFDRFDCWNYILEKKRKGEVKHIGFSYHDGPELLEELLQKHPEVEYVQLQINYLDWKSLGVQSEKCYEVCVKYNKPVIVMEPVKGGTLTEVPDEVSQMFKQKDPDMSIASWAIRFAASLDNVYMVLSGMSNMEQLKDNLSYMEEFVPFDDDRKQMCLKAAEIINRSIAIPCTGCSYCTVNCPVAMPIPKYFSLYNADKQEIASKGWSPHGEYYDNLTLSNPKASECIKCGQCETMCPQHLEIRKYLEDVAQYFER